MVDRSAVADPIVASVLPARYDISRQRCLLLADAVGNPSGRDGRLSKRGSQSSLDVGLELGPGVRVIGIDYANSRLRLAFEIEAQLGVEVAAVLDRDVHVVVESHVGVVGIGAFGVDDIVAAA